MKSIKFALTKYVVTVTNFLTPKLLGRIKGTGRALCGTLNSIVIAATKLIFIEIVNEFFFLSLWIAFRCKYLFNPKNKCNL